MGRKDSKQFYNGDSSGWYSKKGAESDIVLSSRVRFSRNLEGHPFPEKLSFDEEVEVRDEVISAIKGTDRDGSLSLIMMDDLKSIEKVLLFEKRLTSRKFYLEKNKAMFLANDNTLSYLINEADHLRFSAFTGGFELEKVFSRVYSVDKKLEKSLDFAVSLEFGYLNTNIGNSGTGMKASVMVHLPFLVRSSLFDRAIKTSVMEGYSVKGFMGEDDYSLGDIYQISNEISLGESEEIYISRLEKIVELLVEYERMAREEYQRSKIKELEDIFYRAYGLLKYCRLLSFKEAVNSLMDFRLGIIMGWSNIPLEKINSLLIFIQKAHVRQIMGVESDYDSKNMDFLRSELVKAQLMLLQ